MDVRTLILNYEDGPYYAEGMDGYCDEISFVAKGSCGGNPVSDVGYGNEEGDEQDEGAATTATASETWSPQSSEATSSTGTTSQAATLETGSISGVNRETSNLGLAFMGLVLSIAAGM